MKNKKKIDLLLKSVLNIEIQIKELEIQIKELEKMIINNNQEFPKYIGISHQNPWTWPVQNENL